MTGPGASLASGLAAIVVALWIGAGQTAGCIALGLAGMALIALAIAAVIPDRRARR